MVSLVGEIGPSNYNTIGLGAPQSIVSLILVVSGLDSGPESSCLSGQIIQTQL